MIYQMAPFSVTLNDPWPRCQRHAFIRRYISRRRYKMGPQLPWPVERHRTRVLYISNTAIYDELHWPIFKVTIFFQPLLTWKWNKIELYLQWQADRKSVC